MRLVKPVLAIALGVILLSAWAVAGQGELGIADTYKVTFSEKVWVAETLLPSGNYEIRHVMEGADHIMVFRQVGVKKPAEVRAKCTMVPLPEKALETEKRFELNAANERVLHELIFKGDRAKHVF
ncbi:MAG: hypothetical protein WAU58_19325 [Terriglobales bacterium]